jgi:transcriptional regulator with XRE-family HTH domain
MLSRRLQRWRAASGIPLREVARNMGVSISTVSAWEHADRFPSASHLDGLADCIGIPVCALLYDGDGVCSHCRPRQGR